jgi:hypothetical protein
MSEYPDIEKALAETSLPLIVRLLAVSSPYFIPAHLMRSPEESASAVEETTPQPYRTHIPPHLEKAIIGPSNHLEAEDLAMGRKPLLSDDELIKWREYAEDWYAPEHFWTRLRHAAAKMIEF